MQAEHFCDLSTADLRPVKSIFKSSNVTLVAVLSKELFLLYYINLNTNKS